LNPILLLQVAGIFTFLLALFQSVGADEENTAQLVGVLAFLN
jgi:hypothetical protein